MICQSLRSQTNLGHHLIYLVKRGSNAPAKEFVFYHSFCHSFAALLAMMIKISSFKKAKPYLFLHDLKNSIVPVLTYVRMF